MNEPNQLLGQRRILVGNSVYEDADLTINNGTLFIEFASDDLDDVAVDLRACGIKFDGD